MRRITTALLISQLVAFPVFASEVFIDVSAAGTQNPGNLGSGFDANTLTTIFNQLQLFADTTTTQYDTNTMGAPGLNTGDRFLDTGHAIVTDLLPPLGDDEGISTTSELTVSWQDLSGVLTSDLIPIGINGDLVQTFTYDPNNTVLTFYFHGDGVGPNANAGGTGAADNVGFDDGEKVLEMKVVGGSGTNTFSAGGQFLSGSSVLDAEIIFALDDFWYFNNGDAIADPGTDTDFFDLLGMMVPIELNANVDQNTDKVITDFSGAGLAGPAGFGNQLFAVHSTHDGSLDFSVPEPKTLPFFALGLLLILFVRRKLTDYTPSFRIK